MLHQQNESPTSQDVVKVIETTNQGIRSINLSRIAIGYVVRGRKVLYHNDVGTEIGEGGVFLLGLGVHYEENISLSEGFEQILFYISPQTLQQTIISLSSNYGIACDSKHTCERCHYANYLVARPTPAQRDFFAGINHSFRRSDFRNDEVDRRIKLNELIYLILSGEDECLRAMLLGFADVVNGQFAREVYNNLFNDVTIEALARKTNRSLTSFKKEFRRQFAVPPHKWLIDQRLQRAKILLMSTNLTISEIGAECSFSNISHFIKLFKHRFNDTPAAMRRKSRAAM
ncbi:MAG: helix-turn-helix transcriptional regulator [Alistipes sp.]|nr:helix-turn-helix transcriptional regulator [Alistipes sp.]